MKNWRSVQRDFFPFHLRLVTRWADADMYSHQNNMIYIGMMDTIINRYLIAERVLELPGQNRAPFSSSSSSSSLSVFPSCQYCVGLAAETGCSYFGAISPLMEDVDCGLCVTHLGARSVTYRVGMFAAPIHHPEGKSGAAALELSAEYRQLRAVGKFVHVFTDKQTHVPLTKMPTELHDALKKLLVQEPSL